MMRESCCHPALLFLSVFLHACVVFTDFGQSNDPLIPFLYTSLCAVLSPGIISHSRPAGSQCPGGMSLASLKSSGHRVAALWPHRKCKSHVISSYCLIGCMRVGCSPAYVTAPHLGLFTENLEDVWVEETIPNFTQIESQWVLKLWSCV